MGLVIPFNKPYISRTVYEAMLEASYDDIDYRRLAEREIEKITGSKRVILTNSCTSALEIAAICLVEPGDEVILPSFTHPSTANAFVLRGAIPVFVDVIYEAPLMNERDAEIHINKKTKAIISVDYAGLHSTISGTSFEVPLVEDSAQCIESYYRNKHMGTFGTFGTLSFHTTKNIQCGEGGALLVNDYLLEKKCKLISEYGTNRSESKSYKWMINGLSSMTNNITAAMLYENLKDVKEITEYRKSIWNRYYTELKDISNITLPYILKDEDHNAHIFYLGVEGNRDLILLKLNELGIGATSHYDCPLHRSPFGIKYCKRDLPNTDWWADHIIRLPLFYGMTNTEVNYVIDKTRKVLKDEI